MPFDNSFVPYGVYWSSPFCRWQGSLAEQNAIKLAAKTAAKALELRKMSPDTFDSLILGYTVPQRHSFYGAPWLAGMIGAPNISGAMIGQACATSARVLASATLEVEVGQRECVLGVCCDRTSNGPHVFYPNPKGPGGMGEAENPVWDNFSHDPWAKNAMIDTAERLAKEAGISREEQDAVTLRRSEQYAEALADERAFQRRFMVPVELGRGKRAVTLEADEGIHPTTAEGLAKLRPVTEGGTVTFGSQTHPADGNAGIVVCTLERARQLSSDEKLVTQVLGYGEARLEKGRMPAATVPAARAALERSGVKLEDCKVVKTHNPFAVNDIYFAKETGADLDAMNPYGSPLVYGHPQGPTGLRVVVEMIETLASRGGGHGLFTGCAAGDTAMAVVVKVG